jgi:hypothetical protein
MRKDERYVKDWDVFVSYASEDRDSVARSVAEGLRHHGLRVWFDEFELRVGDSLFESINHGLARSAYGVVVLSPSFLAKKWPQRELAALVSLDESNRRRILPIWHLIGLHELKDAAPMLADIIGVQASRGIPYVVRELLRAINLPFTGGSVAGVWHGATGRLRIFEDGSVIHGDYDWNGHEWAGHIEGALERLRQLELNPMQVLRFSWRWDFSPEKGNGFFLVNTLRSIHYGVRFSYYSVGYRGSDEPPCLLTGSWAFDHEDLDTTQRVDYLVQNIKHPWDFRRGKSREEIYAERTQLGVIQAMESLAKLREDRDTPNKAIDGD